MSFEFEKDLKVEETNIPGLLVFDLPVHGDNRGWFKENWQRAKMTALGLPDFGPVQNNISFNATKGVTRGIHAEPWDKYISIAAGEIFGAWVDLRPGESFGQVYTTRLDPSRAIYVPRGVGNSFQALADGTVYTYLVNAHWSLEQKKTYTFVNLADPELDIHWPIPLEESERSEADLHHPMLKDAKPMSETHLVTGCNGQLGHAIRAYAEAMALRASSTRTSTSSTSPTRRHTTSTIGACTDDHQRGRLHGRRQGRNPGGPSNRVEGERAGPGFARQGREGPSHHARARELGLRVRRRSGGAHGGRAVRPAGVYGQTKAAGDIAVGNAPEHYILRSSWVIGEGHNFVKTMMMLSNKVADPEDKLDQVTVVDDQYGRLTFTSDMAGAIFHLLDAHAPYGTYNLTGSGAVKSWADIAREVFDLTNGNGSKVKPISTDQYFANATSPVSPRPTNSALDLTKITETGYTPANWEETLKTYVEKELGR